jgi:hypothetical protein
MTDRGPGARPRANRPSPLSEPADTDPDPGRTSALGGYVTGHGEGWMARGRAGNASDHRGEVWRTAAAARGPRRVGHPGNGWGVLPESTITR